MVGVSIAGMVCTWVRAQMNSIQPGARTEYSRGTASLGGDLAAPDGRRGTLSRPVAIALLTGGLAGAALLVAAEFAPLLTVLSNARLAAVTSVSTSTHDAWALIPLALLAAFLAVGAARTGSRLGMLALGLVGIVAVLIALLGDLPDAQATGLIGSASTRYAVAASTPAAGFYLETLGAALLVIIGGAGLLLSTAPRRSVDAA